MQREKLSRHFHDMSWQMVIGCLYTCHPCFLFQESSHTLVFIFSLSNTSHITLCSTFFFFFLFNFLLLQPSSFSSHYIFIKYIYFTKKLMLFSSGFLNSPLLQNCRIYLRDEGFVYSYQINLIFHFLLEVYNIVNDYLRCLHLLLSYA